MYVINLDYLKNGALHVTELLNGYKKELDFCLDYTAAILDNNNQFSTDLSDLEVEQTKKQEEKAWRHQQRKITLAQATTFANISASLAVVACGLLFAIFRDDFLLAAITSSLLFVVFGEGFLSTDIGSGFLFVVVNSSTSIISSNGFLSLVSGIGSLSFIASSSFLSFITGGSALSFIASSSFLAPVAGCSLFSFATRGSFISLVTSGGLLSPTANGASPSTGLPAFFLSSTPFYVLHSSLSFLAVLFAGFATMLITRKRLFDKVFIKQKLFALT